MEPTVKQYVQFFLWSNREQAGQPVEIKPGDDVIAAATAAGATGFITFDIPSIEIGGRLFTAAEENVSARQFVNAEGPFTLADQIAEAEDFKKKLQDGSLAHLFNGASKKEAKEMAAQYSQQIDASIAEIKKLPADSSWIRPNNGAWHMMADGEAAYNAAGEKIFPKPAVAAPAAPKP